MGKEQAFAKPPKPSFLRRVAAHLKRFSCRSSALEDAKSQLDDTSDCKESYDRSFTTCIQSRTSKGSLSVADPEYVRFLEEYPEYNLTSNLDTMRKEHFARLSHCDEAYVDYMGGSLYPDLLVRQHAALLHQSVLGNTHSVNNSSTLSSSYAEEARSSVLEFFHAPPEYTVIFTSNASAALKLVGESFPFSQGSAYVLAEDSHNSVHGIRHFASRAGARVSYIQCDEHGGFDEANARSALRDHAPPSSEHSSLFAITGQSNISNFKAPLELITLASSLGYSTLLDAAALAATSTISLADINVDAMAVSFYKMFGYPTGIGALVVKKSFLSKLNRPWFAGGTVDIVQVPGSIVTMAQHIHEQFEDGTINYLSLPAVTNGLRFLSDYLPMLPLRLSSLTRHLIASLESIRYTSGAPVASVLSTRPSRRLSHIGEQADAGSVVSFIFRAHDGGQLPNGLVAHASARRRISLRTGCMCNPGGAAALLGLRHAMASLTPDATLAALESAVGAEVGVVRVSLGLASDFSDVQRVIAFAREIADEDKQREMRREWENSRGPTQAVGVCHEGRTVSLHVHGSVTEVHN